MKSTKVPDEAIEKPAPTRKLFRLPVVIEITGLCRASIYARIAQGTFPAPVQLGVGARAVAWKESEINEWVDSLPIAPYRPINPAAKRKTA